MLRLCQDAGFTLAEIHELMEREARDPTAWRAVVRRKMPDVQESLRRLRKAHQILAHALECPYADITECPSFQAAVDHRLGPAEPDGALADGELADGGLADRDLAAKLELAAVPHPHGHLVFGHEGQERDGAGQQDQHGSGDGPTRLERQVNGQPQVDHV